VYLNSFRVSIDEVGLPGSAALIFLPFRAPVPAGILSFSDRVVVILLATMVRQKRTWRMYLATSHLVHVRAETADSQLA